jgi:hypothetical protein
MNSRVPASDENALLQKNRHATTWPLGATNNLEKQPPIATRLAFDDFSSNEQSGQFLVV